MKFIRVLKADVTDRSRGSRDIFRDYTINLPDFSLLQNDSKKYKEIVLDEMQTCKDVITSDFLNMYNSNYKSYTIQYTIYLEEPNEPKKELGFIHLTKHGKDSFFEEGTIFIGFSKNHASGRTTNLHHEKVSDEQSITTYINKYLNLIIKEAKNNYFE